MPSPLKRVIKNAGKVFTGAAIGSAFALAAILIAARHLGASAFGTLALLFSYLMLLDGLFNFQSWQTLIRYGALARSKSSRAEYRGLLRFGLILDALGVAAATTVGVFAVPVAGAVLGWGEGVTNLAPYLCIVLLTRIVNTPLAILRLEDRFDLIAYHQVIVSVWRLGFAAVGSTLDLGLLFFIVAWAAAEVIGNGFLIGSAYLVDRRSRFGTQPDLRTISWLRNRQIWVFAFSTNLHGSVKQGIKEADLLLVGAILGTQGAGLYKLVKQIGAVIAKATGPLYQSSFPELANAVAERDRATFQSVTWSMIGPIAMLTGSLVVLFALLAPSAIPWLLGADYALIYWPALLYLIGVSINCATITLQPAALALGRATAALVVLILSTLVYLLCLTWALHAFDLVGAGIAYIVFYVVWAGSMALLVFAGRKHL